LKISSLFLISHLVKIVAALVVTFLLEDRCIGYPWVHLFLPVILVLDTLLVLQVYFDSVKLSISYIMRIFTGAGASSGIGTAGFELSALFILIMLGWIFLPVYIRAGVSFL
jgi:hypothetical protein